MSNSTSLKIAFVPLLESRAMVPNVSDPCCSKYRTVSCVHFESPAPISHNVCTKPFIATVEPAGVLYVKVNFFTKTSSPLTTRSSFLMTICVSMYGMYELSARCTQTFTLYSVRASSSSPSSGPDALTIHRYCTLPSTRWPSELSQ